MTDWRPIPFAPCYEADRDGRVRNAQTKREMKFQRRCDGYYQICLRLGLPKALYRKRSKIVAHTFLEPMPSPRMVVAHKDGSRDNDHADNLYWATQKENHADRERHGRAPKGSRNGASFLTEDQVLAIRIRLDAGDRQKDIAEDFGVCSASVSHIKTKKHWSHL